MTPELYNLCETLGLTVERSINWTWILGFASKEAAEEFLLHPHVYEHRGIHLEQDGTYSAGIR